MVWALTGPSQDIYPFVLKPKECCFSGAFRATLVSDLRKSQNRFPSIIYALLRPSFPPTLTSFSVTVVGKTNPQHDSATAMRFWPISLD